MQTRKHERIATEEAYAPVKVLNEYRRLLEGGGGDRGFRSLWTYYLKNESVHTNFLVDRIQDLGERRLADMDRLGIDRQVVGLTCPGVELFDVPLARDLAQLTNDRIAEACRRHPKRFVGLAAVALQDVEFSVNELHRAVNELGLKGVIINSHTRGEYLDDPKFEPIFAAAAELDVPLYLHPNTPSDALIGPLLDGGLDTATFGFGVETGMHLIRIIFSGIFDKYPTLRMGVGHLGEGLPFWLFRIDHYHGVHGRTKRYPFRPDLREKPSYYLRNNIWLTTSGMAWEPAISFTRSVVGEDRVIYAMDYPYQVSAEEIAAQDALPLDDKEKKYFFETGARQLFGIDA
ncbi:amidohydrolase family protein [Streptomyces thinghirensis]|uniref:Amidohydrolase family protein n=1 Tax=Streptomyces thinghirensis TaxID=551547 RepID=A0ABP9T8I0_9ACTN